MISSQLYISLRQVARALTSNDDIIKLERLEVFYTFEDGHDFGQDGVRSSKGA
jgi:hypothetical protein